MLTIYAPAKINLVLEVLGKYDGYHQISSIFQTINLCDTLRFQLAERISFKCSEPSLERNNLVTEAATLLKNATKYNKGGRIELGKNIPWGVGLGGGSSDAASTLLALNKLWELKLPVSELVHLAAKLGSDVPFFIYGGTALVEGKGEKVTPLPSLPPTWFVLLVPPLAKIQDKAKQLYSRLDASHFTKGQFVQAALPSLKQGKTLAPILMFNVFEKVAFDFLPNLAKYKKSFEEAGAASVYLTGSGPCLFTFVSGGGEANELCLRLRKQGLECYVASSSPKGG
jgi:4-diphosphocytidyl-2-C-methyl-D-erythritol kinase